MTLKIAAIAVIFLAAIHFVGEVTGLTPPQPEKHEEAAQ